MQAHESGTLPTAPSSPGETLSTSLRLSLPCFACYARCPLLSHSGGTCLSTDHPHLTVVQQVSWTQCGGNQARSHCLPALHACHGSSCTWAKTANGRPRRRQAGATPLRVSFQACSIGTLQEDAVLLPEHHHITTISAQGKHMGMSCRLVLTSAPPLPVTGEHLAGDDHSGLVRHHGRRALHHRARPG